MADDIGEHANDIIAKLQQNTFVCDNCQTMATFAGSRYVPCFPCGECGKVKWKIFSINDVVIYK